MSALRWIAAVALVCIAGPALACKCALTSRDEAIASSSYVFEGRVANIETDGTTQVTTMTVAKMIKGPLRGVIKVKSNTESASCGYDFREADKLLTVGAERSDDGFTVRRCTMYNLNR